MNRARRLIKSGACLWRRSAHYALNRRLKYGCSIELAADKPRKRSSKAIGRPGVTLKREASGQTVYAGFSAISLQPQQQRHPQSQHHQSYAINWNTLRALTQSVQQVDYVDDRSDQEDDPADSELMKVYHTESPICAVNCNSFCLGISISLDPAAQNANIIRSYYS
jgi:hypothetical protein